MKTLALAVVGSPGTWETEKLCEAIRALGHEGMVIPPEECSLCLHKGQVTHRQIDLSTFDAVLVQTLGDIAEPATRFRVHILRHLERLGVPVFPKPDAIEATMDRYRMTLELARAGLPVPPTLVTEQIEHAILFLEAFGASVFKPVFTSGGRGMAVLSDPAEARGFLKAQADAGGLPFYLQRYISSPARHASLVVVGGDFLSAYVRPWRTPGSRTGREEAIHPAAFAPIEPTSEEIMLARDAARLFGLDYATVGMVVSETGPLIYDVEPWGSFFGPWSVGEIDAAAVFLSHVLKAVSDAPPLSAAQQAFTPAMR